MQDILSGLNEPQREAVTHTDGPLLVLAGAGSGKTRVLTRRIAYLVREQGVPVSRILAMTFTNKAAGEMRERVERLLEKSLKGMWAGTFHSLCARILRMDGEAIGVKENFAIYAQAEQVSLTKRLISAMDLDEDQYPARQVHSRISKEKNLLHDPGMMATLAKGPYERTVSEVYEKYDRELRRNNALDFDDLLVLTVRLFHEHREIADKYAQRFQHILIDEYQDTNRPQYAITRILAAHHRNLCVVGDDDQCLVPGTMIAMADGSEVPIESIQPGSVVRTALGRGRFGEATVSAIHRTMYRGPAVRITTQSGKCLTSTPEHMHFAGFRMGISPQKHMAYLMYREGFGFRIGVTRTYTNSGRLGYETRSIQEHADAGWILGVHLSENDARLHEEVMALRYGIPKLPFTPRKGHSRNGLVHDAGYIRKLHTELDTMESGQRLMTDIGYYGTSPHYRSQSRNSCRPTVSICLCADSRYRNSTGHRLSIVVDDPEMRDALVDIGLSVREVKRGSRSWRIESVYRDYGKVSQIADQISAAIGATQKRTARIGQNASLPFTPASQVLPGMVVCLADGSLDVVSDVCRLEIDAEVYDLDVPPTHNFIADGIVTHNSIYGWRGADIRNILDFERDYPDARVVRLEQNYRSTRTILDVANAVIEHNQDRKGKNLRTEGQAGDKVLMCCLEDERVEAEWICRKAQDLQEDGIDYPEIAVLYRTNAQSRAVEDEFRRQRVPYVIVGGLKFYDRREIRDILAYLRFATNPDDWLSLRRIINVPRRGIGGKTLSAIEAAAVNGDMSPIEVLKNPERGGMGARVAGAVRAFASLVLELQQHIGDPVRMVRQTIRQTGYLEHLGKLPRDEAESRSGNVMELAAAIEEYCDNVQGATMEGFLREVALVADADTQEGDRSGVTLMTIHAAKGLEFPAVFVTGLEDGLFPILREDENNPIQAQFGNGRIEEERRLFYVAITRAQKRLFLSLAYSRRRFGGYQITEPSRFLGELPKNLVEAERYSRSATWQPPRRQEDPHPGDIDPDERVRHPKWGVGTIIDTTGHGDGAKLTVRFDNGEEKRLMARYANLEAV